MTQHNSVHHTHIVFSSARMYNSRKKLLKKKIIVIIITIIIKTINNILD